MVHKPGRVFVYSFYNIFGVITLDHQTRSTVRRVNRVKQRKQRSKKGGKKFQEPGSSAISEVKEYTSK